MKILLLICFLLLSTPAFAKHPHHAPTSKHDTGFNTVSMLVTDGDGNHLFARNSQYQTPIASITKLMTAVVTLDANLPMDETLTITKDDYDRVKFTHSMLNAGASMSRYDTLWIAIMASENRAAHMLGRTYPTGLASFVDAMNAKAATLGMVNTHFVDPTGLYKEDVSTAEDLAKLVIAASNYDLIRKFTSSLTHEVSAPKRLKYHNANALAHVWDVQVTKTGFIRESGSCVVIRTHIEDRDLVFILLKSAGIKARMHDALALKQIVMK